MDVFREEGLLASLEFMTRPKIQDIGSQASQPQTQAGFSANGQVDSLRQAPQSSLVGDDSNWVSGQLRGRQNPRYADAPGTTGWALAQGHGFHPSPPRGSVGSMLQLAYTTVTAVVV